LDTQYFHGYSYLKITAGLAKAALRDAR
jgi:hypothetical protein